MTMYKRNARANNNQLSTIYQGVHITHFKSYLIPILFALSKCFFMLVHIRGALFSGHLRLSLTSRYFVCISLVKGIKFPHLWNCPPLLVYYPLLYLFMFLVYLKLVELPESLLIFHQIHVQLKLIFWTVLLS